MSALVDTRPHAEAIKAALTATVGPNRVYEYGEVPGADNNAGTLPPIFVLLTVERRFGGTRRAGAYTDTAGWRVTVRAVGRTVDECRWTLAKIAAALDEKRLTIGGESTTPIQFESGQPPELDEGRFAALDIYTYAL